MVATRFLVLLKKTTDLCKHLAAEFMCSLILAHSELKKKKF